MKWSSYWSMANITTWRFLTFSEKEIGLALCLQGEGCWSDWPNTDSVFSTLASVVPWNLCRISRLCFLLVILRTAVVMCHKKANLTSRVLSLPVWHKICGRCPAERHACRVIISSLERWTTYYCLMEIFFILIFQFTCTTWFLITLTISNSACMVMFFADLTRTEYLRLAIFSYYMHISTFYLTQVLIAFIAFLASHHKCLVISYIPFLHHSGNPPLLHKCQHLLTKETWRKVT